MTAEPTRHTTIRFSAADLLAIRELAALWGPVEPLSITGVLREAVRRCLDLERRRETIKAKGRPARAAGEG